MANTDNVYVAQPTATGGTFYRAVKGTPLPEDAIEALDVAFKDLGYVGDDGYTYTITRDATDINAFGGDIVASPQQSYKEEIKVTLLESNNLEALKTAFGDDAVSVAGGVVTVARSKAILPRSSFVVDTVGQDGGERRIVIPNGQVTTVGDIVYVHSDVVKYELTIVCYPDLNGKPSYEYSEEPAS
ncbi:major tail protein [Gordonia phage Ronaldo]|uniref:Major tail protein n=4 Tax=Ronaldovirus TaxID=2733205 RepID=A0A6B9LAE6_9CAUD|nr:major tail protein [Gordonia phage Fryberger]YP_009807744.1 major tail protein [Gordonia phage Ronaldo]QDH48387.1 major tail protein [Gordonia phage Ziko]QHB38163.1 major tail protein [Gordonia phage Volt]QTF81835.1 major tail protein [Gordonia phage Guey18]AXN53463.1 major tail protein [Gordonia phage Fryberger]AXN53610.1 hypothetical protein SEA_RONALDO_48 [Gordonia phage Ronaldo]